MKSAWDKGAGPTRLTIVLLVVALLLAAGSLDAAAQSQTFGGGTQLVGPDVAAGRYVATSVDGCYWERLSGLSGEFDELIANDFVGTAQQVVVDIAPSDVAFNSSSCAPWTHVSNSDLAVAESIGNGSWIVSTQIFPGQYRTADAVDGCYWERLAGFGGGSADRIANDFVVEGQPVVEIVPGDAGFLSSSCGSWEPLFSLPVRCDSKFVTIDMNLGASGTGTSGNDVILGTPGDDAINGLGGDDIVCAGGGNDTVRGGAGADWIDGEAGEDTIRGGGGGDTLLGGDDGDVIDGQGGADTMYGGAGEDSISGRGAADMIFGGGADDTIDGHNGVDIIDGGAGDDVIKGQTGADELTGGDGDDDLFGGNGNDTLYGGPGTDKCAGNFGPADRAEAASCETTPGVETLF